MPNALLSIQIIPKTPNGEDVIPYVDRAIQVIQESGIKHQVNALETTMEGDLDQLLEIVKQMNVAVAEFGSTGILSQIKISYNPAKGVSMDKLVEKYRP